MPITIALPCEYQLFEEVKRNGAIVDMNKLQFPNISESEQKKTALIFLRNTEFDQKVILDFSDCSYEDKAEFLKLYIESNIEIKNKAFSLTWVKILNWVIGYNLNIDSILTEEEIQKFVDENVDYIGNILQFIISTPLYVLSTFVIDEKPYGIDDSVKQTDEEPVGVNINSILSQPDIINVFTVDYTFEPLFYKGIFKPENTELFNSLNYLPFMSLLVGLKDVDEKSWLSYLQEISAFNEVLK